MTRLKYMKSPTREIKRKRPKRKRRKKCPYTIFQLHHNNYNHLDDPTIPEDVLPVRMKFHYVLTLLRRFKSISSDEKKAVRYVLKHWATYRITKEDKKTIARLWKKFFNNKKKNK